MSRPLPFLAALGLTVLLGQSAHGQAGVAFQPIVGAANNGVALPGTAVVSADRRYVRLSVNPQFNGIEGFSTYSVPAAVGGGFGGPAALPRGVLGVAGMDGVSDGVGYRMSSGRSASPGYSSGDMPFAGLPPGQNLMAAQLAPEEPTNTPPPKATRRKKGRVSKAERPVGRCGMIDVKDAIRVARDKLVEFYELLSIVPGYSPRRGRVVRGRALLACHSRLFSPNGGTDLETRRVARFRSKPVGQGSQVREKVQALSDRRRRWNCAGHEYPRTMTEHVVELFRRYSPLGVVIDTNLLLLLCVGDFDSPADQHLQTNREEQALLGGRGRCRRRPERIFRGTIRFTPGDYKTLAEILRPFGPRLMTLPNILTEVNSLANQLDEGSKPRFFESFSRRIKVLREEHRPSAEAASLTEFSRYGLTDLGIFLSARGRFLVLTDDLKLGGFLRKQDVDVLNFNHFRSLD